VYMATGQPSQVHPSLLGTPQNRISPTPFFVDSIFVGHPRCQIVGNGSSPGAAPVYRCSVRILLCPILPVPLFSDEPNRFRPSRFLNFMKNVADR